MTDGLTIALDAMGGDHGPSVVVEGAVLFFRECPRQKRSDVKIILVGEEDVLARKLTRLGGARLPIEIRHASQVITMDDHPAESLKAKPESSLAVMAGLQREGVAQAMVSPGNTGAMMAASMFALGRIEGVQRPALAGTFPSRGNPTVVVDVGANVDCKPEQLRQFALMGSAYSSGVFGIENPRVALLNVGSERTKGTRKDQIAYGLIENSTVNFTGNIEGDGILKGEADVVVCDGFIGNVLLKVTESISELIGGSLYLDMKRHWVSRAGYLLMRHSFAKLWKKLDSAEYGGVPLLGLNGVSIVAHGSSNSKAIKNALLASCDFYRGGVNDMIRDILTYTASRGENQ
jgi:glycerol-3-phosphate acyltransferase PlsX